MDPARWQQVRDIFELLVDRDDRAIRSELERVRERDPSLADEVASLLSHLSMAGSFLCRPMPLATDGPTWAPGERLGIYLIEREAGRGGMGRVYVATDTRLNRRVCLKVVPPALVSVPAARERLRREAQVAASIHHPSVCGVYALEEIDGLVIIATEYIEGNTLRDLLAAGPLDAHLVTTIARELAAALAAIHERGVTHGDVKPENVMWSRRGELKLLDFGLSRVHGSRTADDLTEVLAGTLTYMAPEQINGAAADARSDVFAFGIVMFECAAGVHPFVAPTALATTARILEHEPAFDTIDARVPPSVARVIERCLRKLPVERFATGAAILAALGETSATVQRAANTPWWRIHQLAATLLYLVACAAAWVAKEWDGRASTRWLFIAVGVLAALAGIMRGHLLFTAREHPHRLGDERRRKRRSLLIGDLALAVFTVFAGVAIGDVHPVAAVLVIALAVAIAVAVIVIEPATSAAAFGELEDR